MSFDKDKLIAITSKTHTQQAIWFLNGFWNDGMEQNAEKVWGFVHLMIEIQTGEPKLYGRRQPKINETADLDEMQAHHFLERMDSTLTVRELRARLKKLDVDNNNRMALSEYLLNLYNKTPRQLIMAPQGACDPEKLAAAQAAVDKASAAVADAIEALAAAVKAKAALAIEQKAFDDKISKLEDAVANGGSAVKKLRAKNELAQAKDEDPLPLRRAKITASSAVKRGPKMVAMAKQMMAAAEDQLQAIRMAGDGGAMGALWWMERELKERKKFMPK